MPLPDLWLYGEPYPTLNAVVLEPEEHASLVALTERFATIFHKAVRALQRDAGALQRLGFPWVALELLAREAPDEPFILGRFDFVLDAGGAWQVLEYNADTPSGTRETVAVEGVVAAAPAGDGAEGRRARGSDGWRAGGHRPAPGRAPCAGPSPGPWTGCRQGATLGIVTDAGYAEDLSQAVFLHRHLAPALARRGLRTCSTRTWTTSPSPAGGCTSWGAPWTPSTATTLSRRSWASRRSSTCSPPWGAGGCAC